MGRRKRLLVGKYQISDRPAQQESPGIEVKLGWDISSNESVTVKAFDLAKFDTDNQEGVGELIKFEMRTLWRLGHHPHVVRLVDVFTFPAKNKTFVVVEAVSGGGDLFETIATKGRLEDDSARYYFAQLLDAVEHCHARGVCHRDIKPENVLLDARGNVKLTGFALAGLFDPSLGDNHVENLLHATCGTPDYTAPEVIQGFAYEGTAVDVWSLGVTLYAMLAGYLPFEAESLPDVFDKAQAGDFKAAPGMSVEARSLLDCMLEPDPESRYTMQDVRAHPWLAGRAHKHQQERQHRSNHQHQHHRAEEASVRWNERSPPLAGGASPDGLAQSAQARDVALKGVRHGGSDGGERGTQGWSLDSFVRRQQRRQQEGTEPGQTDERREHDWCEQRQQQHNGAPRDSRGGSSYAAEGSTTSGGGQWGSVNSSSTAPSSFRREGYDSPFQDCPSPSEGEEETVEGQGETAVEGEGVKGRVGLDNADGSGACSSSSVAVSAADGGCSSTTSGTTVAAPRSSRSVYGPKAASTSGTISIARRLGATRLVLSLQLLDNGATSATAETDRGEDPGDHDVKGLIPAKALQRALESLGCVCRLLLPTKKRSDEHKTPRVRVKACRAIVAADGGGLGEGGFEAEEDEADSIVGVMFSVILSAEAPAPPGVTLAVDVGDSIDGRSSSSGGSRSNPRPEITEFLAVLSAGTAVAFNALVGDLQAVPALTSPSSLASAMPYSMHAEGRKERRQARSRRGRTLGIGGGGMGGRQCAGGVERRKAAATTTSPADGN